MRNSIRRRRASSSGSGCLTSSAREHDADASAVLATTVPAALKCFTLSRGRKESPLQFDGEILAEVQTFGVAAGYRAAIYKTRDGNFITEFSLISMPHLTGGEPERGGRAAAFDTLDAACAWFQPGRLTTRLLKQVGK